VRARVRANAAWVRGRPALTRGLPGLCALRPSAQGVVFPTRIGRLEVNYCVTLRAQEHDRPKRGVQFGLRPSSL
jgi:hypothetical protein